MSYNPFASYDLYLPTMHKDKIDKFTRTSGGRDGVLISPFARQVDLWFTALLYGAAKNMPPSSTSESYKFIQGSIFSNEPYRITTIQLVALGRAQDTAILTNPKEMLDLVSGIVFSALPHLIIELEDPDAEKPLWALLEMYEKISE
jgi:hypothetical protein